MKSTHQTNIITPKQSFIATVIIHNPNLLFMPCTKYGELHNFSHLYDTKEET